MLAKLRMARGISFHVLGPAHFIENIRELVLAKATLTLAEERTG
jgi:hypothetical protein